ncbi:MAG: hypothetical protein ACRDE8_09760 [Ginsengibacter sp.]
MKRKFIYILVIVSLSFNASAQKQIQFHSINSAGFLMGQSSGNALLQTVNGIRFKNFFTGVGIGIDYYRYKTLPLFFDGRKYFGKKNNGFAYADLGYDFPLKNKPGKEILYYGTYKFNEGIYTDFGLGYKWKLIKKASFLLSAGYSYKKIFEKIGTTNPGIDCAIGISCPVDYTTYNYGFGRIVLKAGVDF